MKKFYEEQIEWYTKQVEWYKEQVAWSREYMPNMTAWWKNGVRRMQYALKKYKRKLALIAELSNC